MQVEAARVGDAARLVRHIARTLSIVEGGHLLIRDMDGWREGREEDTQMGSELVRF